MSDFNLISNQLGKTRFQPRLGKWVRIPELRPEDEFSNAEVTPFQPHSHATTSNLRFRTITKQLGKKRVSNKSKKERILAKSVLLADRLD